MVPWILLLIPLVSPVTAGVDKTFGVPPNLVAKYVPLKSGTWKCLDGSNEIPWDFVNDDSCDCADGSDEPGTGACPNTKFYCRNEGHIGSSIPSSRVKDGLCEPECCDGSDERPGVCENMCKDVGEAYRKKRDEQRKLQKTGSKIRSSYIAFAKKEKKRLEEHLKTLSQDIGAKEKEVERLRDIAERTESISQAALEHKKESPLYKSFMIHHNALKSLQREHKKHLEREQALGQILDALRSGYNPNYQDMAVLEAVRGWEELAELPHINDVGKDDTETADESSEEKAEDKVTETPAEEKDPAAWTEDQLKYQLDSLLDTDYVSLLLEHEEHIRAPTEATLIFDIASYLPDSLLPHYDAFKDTLLEWLESLGVIRPDTDNTTADSSKARQALTSAENTLSKAKKQIEETEGEIAEIFNIHGFGAEGEWKKLDGTCFEKNTGDYTYELCMFDEVKQKPNSGGTTFSLGKFDSWNNSPDIEPGSPEFYSKQYYKHGTRCWNGPERNVVLKLSCGIENALLSVQELEKCEYEFIGTSPALCLPLEDDKNSRDEL